MINDKFSPDLNQQHQRQRVKHGTQISKSFWRKSCESGTITNGESNDFTKQNFMDQQMKDKQPCNTFKDLNYFISQDLTAIPSESAPSKLIKSSKALYYRFLIDENLEAEDKFTGFPVYRKYSDSNIESRATSLLNLQIKDLEHRTKSSRLSTSSQRQIQISEFDDHDDHRQLNQLSYLNDDNNNGYRILNCIRMTILIIIILIKEIPIRLRKIQL
jgi:hypothetical protein